MKLDKKLKTFSICGIFLMLLAGCGQKEDDHGHSVSSQASSSKVVKQSTKKTKAKDSEVISIGRAESQAPSAKIMAKQSSKQSNAKTLTSKSQSFLLPQLLGTWYHYSDKPENDFDGSKGLITLKIEGNTITTTTSKKTNVQTVDDPDKKSDIKEGTWERVVPLKRKSMYGLNADCLIPSAAAGYCGSAQQFYSTTTLNIDGKKVEVLIYHATNDAMFNKLLPVTDPVLFYHDKNLAIKQKDNVDYPIFKHPKLAS